MAKSRLGPLALESQLGRQGSGTTWRGLHIQLRKPLAVKVFHTPFGGTLESRQAFAHEWERLKHLKHPSIAECYGGGFEGDDAYLGYQLIEGESLEERVERRGKLSWEEVLEEAEALVGALDYLHERHLYYGVLSPKKIRFSGSSPVLVDVRIDRFGSTYRSVTPPNPFELAFIPPENLRERKEMSVKGDLYSLGAVMFYALSGRPPFSGKTAGEVSDAVQKQPPPKIAQQILDCPIWLSSLIDQLLEKEPRLRPHSAKSVSLAIGEVRKRAAEGIGIAQHAAAGFSPLRVGVDKQEARELLGYAAKEVHEAGDQRPPIYERIWFLVTILALMAASITWFLWPLSEQQLRARAESLLANDDRSSMLEARDRYLLPLVSDHPGSPGAQWAQARLDEIEMLETERQMERRASRGQQPASEGERLYLLARQYESFGDSASAREKYQSLVDLLEASPQHKAYVQLARRQIGKITATNLDQGERQQLVSQKLAEAEELARKGKLVEARKIWYSIVELYETNLEMKSFVLTAQTRLAEKPPT